MIIGKPSPMINNFPNKLLVLLALIKNLKNNSIQKNTKVNPPINPYSSTMMAKIKSEIITEDERKVNDMKYSIRESLKQENELDNEGDSLVNGQNPMNAVLNKK